MRVQRLAYSTEVVLVPVLAVKLDPFGLLCDVKEFAADLQRHGPRRSSVRFGVWDSGTLAPSSSPGR